MIDALPWSIAIVRGESARLVFANQATDSLWGTHWQAGQAMQEFVRQHQIAIVDVQGHALPPEAWATLRALQSALFQTAPFSASRGYGRQLHGVQLRALRLASLFCFYHWLDGSTLLHFQASPSSS